MARSALSLADATFLRNGNLGSNGNMPVRARSLKRVHEAKDPMFYTLLMATQVFNLTAFKQSFPVTHNFLSSDSLEIYLRIWSLFIKINSTRRRRLTDRD